MIFKFDEKKTTNTFFLSIILIYIFYIIYKLNYYISVPDEINYLLNGLFLLEGIKPHYSHAPSSFITWISFFKVLLELFFSYLLNFIQIISSSDFFFNQTNLIITNHYQDLSNLRSIVFFFHIIILIITIGLINNLEINNFQKIIFTLLLFSSPLFLYTISLTLPNFTGWSFLIISFILAQKKKTNLVIIAICLGIAASNRLELILSCPFIYFYLFDNKKANFKDALIFLFYVFIIFILLAPWFIGDLYANIKTLTSYFFNNFSSSSFFNFGNDISFKYEKFIYLNSLFIFILYLLKSIIEKKNTYSSKYLFLLNIFYLLSFFITPKPILHMGFIIILNYLIFLNLFVNFSKKSIKLFILLVLFINFISSILNLNLIYGEKQALHFLNNNLNMKNLTIYKPQTFIELNTNKSFYLNNVKLLKAEKLYQSFNSNIRPLEDNFFYTKFSNSILYNIPNTKLIYGIYRRYFFINENINTSIKDNIFNIKILGNNKYLAQMHNSKFKSSDILYTVNINDNNKSQYDNFKLLFKKGNVEIYNTCSNSC